MADRFDAPILEVVADRLGDVADSRRTSICGVLGKTVTRAALDESRPRCRKAGAAYFREQHRLVGRAHEVRRSGRGYKVDPEPKRPFSRKLFMDGLTPKGRAAVSELQALGNPEPSPAAVLEFLLRNPRLPV